MNFFKEFIDAKRLKFIGEGRHRAVFKTRSGRYVVKFPVGEGGELANYREARDFKESGDRLARCRIIVLQGVECLVMEFVTMAKGPLPSWVDFIDCQQVGITRRGELVAYDWS